MHSYATRAYAECLAHIGRPVPLAGAGGFLLEREFAEGLDAVAPYPLLVCRDWQKLGEDLEARCGIWTSVTAVVDPVAGVGEAELRAAFGQRVRAYKTHFVRRLGEELERDLPAYHLRRVKRARARVQVQWFEPGGGETSQWQEDWLRLYGGLAKHHSIRGAADFPADSLAAQLTVPGAWLQRARIGGCTVAMVLWYEHGAGVAYHLGASDAEGYAANASYGLFADALARFTDLGREFALLGGAAGLEEDASDGLTRFKAGWANERRTAWLCGRVLDEQRYARWCAAAGCDPAGAFSGLPGRAGASMKNEQRSAQWKRNPDLENWLREMGELLGPMEAESQERVLADGREWPLVFVIGAPRSGTTLLMQWLAASGDFAYPSNWLSRFAAAPTIGARLQRLWHDARLDFRGELADLAPAPPGFDSQLGKTRGALAPNEFWYLWRRYLPTEEIAALGERTAQVDHVGLGRVLQALAAVPGKPFASKGMMMQYDLEFFARHLPRALFVHVRRDGVANAQSLLRARESFFGDRSRWYSAKPAGFEALAGASPEQQVVWQVHETGRVIDAALAVLPAEQWLTVPYEAFCADPGALHAQLWQKLLALGGGAGGAMDGASVPAYTGPESFRCSDPSPERRWEEPELQELARAWHALQ
ncbi:MAG: sulfotransferase [Planctomycetota bacterium]